MKQLIFLMMGVMFFSFLSAQNNTKVLLEMTTATGCYHCPSGNHYIDSLANLHPDKVIVLRYQFPLNSYDPIYYQDSAEINQRSKAIFPTGQFGLPGTYCNGVYHKMGYPDRLTSDSIDSVYRVRNHFLLEIGHQVTVDCDSLDITFTITSDTIQEFAAGKLFAHIVLMEDSIFFKNPPGNNGEKDFFFECRKFVPEVTGWQIPDQWSAGMTRTYSYKVPIPGYIYDLNNLYVIGFIQNNSNLHILQSAKDHQQKLPYYAGIDIHKSLNFPPFTCDTILNGAKVFVKNMGTATLTSFRLLYRVHGGIYDTLQWTGSVPSDSLAEITLPPLGISGDGHKTIDTQVIYPNEHWVVESFASQFSSSIEVNVIPDEPPVHEYFTRTGFPYKGWFIYNPNRDGNTWMQNKTTSVSGYYMTSLFLRSFTMMPGTINEFYPPEITVHQMSSMTLYFDIAHIMTGGAPDTLEIFLSDNCGKSWTLVYKKTGNEFAYTSIPWPEWINGVPDSTEVNSWKRQTANLTGYAMDSKINLRFKYTRGEGNNVHIRNLYIGPGVGIPDRHADAFSIHPNPAQGMITIESTNGERIMGIEVFNLMGAVVFSKMEPIVAGDKLTIDLTGLHGGIYMVRIKTRAGWITKKIIITGT